MSDTPVGQGPAGQDPARPPLGPSSRREPAYREESAFRPRTDEPMLQRTFPVSKQLPSYPQRSLRGDALAGATVAALALPSAMAYAQLAGLSPVAGLYGLLLPAVAYVVLGSSRQLIVGPEGSIALLVAISVAPLAGGRPETYASLAAMLAVLVSGIYLVARIVRLGWIAEYFSRSVLVGYIHGVAVVLIVGQLGKLFGVSITAREPLDQVSEFVRNAGDIKGLTAMVGLGSLAVLLILRWRLPQFPAPLVVVVGGIIVSAVFSLVDHGVAVVGHIPAGLPSIRWPGVPATDTAKLLPAALGIFAVSYADGILTARSFAGRHGQRVDANQELIALGAANFAAGITQAFPVGASGSRTAVNDQVGGRTQVVGLFGAVVIALILLFFTAPVEKLPSACLGAVIVAAALGLIEPDAWRALARVGRAEVLIAAVACAGVIVFGVLEALVVAVGLSILDIVRRSGRPHDAVLGWVPGLGRYGSVELHRSAQVTPGVVVYRLDDRLIFANAGYFQGRAAEAVAGAPTPTKWFVLDAEAISGIDASGVEAVEQVRDSLQAAGISMAVARMKTPIKERFDATGLTAVVGEDHFYPNVQAAVQGCVSAGGRADGEPTEP